MDEREMRDRLNAAAKTATFGSAGEAAGKLRTHLATRYGVSEDDVAVEADGGNLNATVRRPPSREILIDVVAVPISRGE